ncbi:NosD domain-containing protein [Rhodomicrobium sp.]|uniref:NosD domain-containing protein n=1 Tax=Rhodomicrobium sp. TaxID=2720632 RepID=UPI0039E5BD23
MGKLKRASAIFVLPLALMGQQVQADPAVEVLKVTRYGDDGGTGTLRWALEENNKNPGHYQIDIDAVGAAPYAIVVKSELPPIKGPVKISFPLHDENGSFVAIDGSGYVGPSAKDCPGAVPGQFGTNVRTTTKPGIVLQDTQDVEIAGIEIRNFCIGVLINRASRNVIRDSRIVGNHGGAGIMITGDDGKGASTSTTTNNNKILRNYFFNNGDAMELTRGAAFNLLADNFITNDGTIEEPSQGLEILWGNDNSIVRNHFENQSDGVQLNWGNRNYIAANTFTKLSSAVTLSGTGNIVDGNIMTGNRVAVSVRPQAAPGPNGTPGRNRITGPAVNRITANSMFDNGKDIERCFAGGACLPEHKGAIVFGVPGLEHDVFVGNRGGGIDGDTSKMEKICAPGVTAPDCEPMPNHNQSAPKLVAANPAASGVEIKGEVEGQPKTLYRIEFFANTDASSKEAEIYLGFANVPLDASGKGSFTYVADAAKAASAANFTATATTVDGATSMLSTPLANAVSRNN